MTLQNMIVSAVVSLIAIDILLRCIDYSLYRAACYLFFGGIVAVWDFCNGVFQTRMVAEVVENNGNLALLKTSHGSEFELFRKNLNLTADEFAAKFPVGEVFSGNAGIRWKLPFMDQDEESLYEWIARVGVARWTLLFIVTPVWNFFMDCCIAILTGASFVLQKVGL